MGGAGFQPTTSARAALTTTALVTFVCVSIAVGGAAEPQQAAAPQTREVTFTKDIAPIAFAQCAYCHRPGEVAPFSFMTYKDVRPWARSISKKVVNGEMPPWKADPHYGSFQNARTLSQQEIDTFVAWVDGGAREGNPADMPPAPQFADGWQIGTPDLVLQMKEPYVVPAQGDVPWMTVPSNEYVFPEDTWIQAVEVRPGNRRVVHHAVAQANFPSDNPGLGGSGLHLYSPGLDAIVWREGYGKLMPKGTRISFQMHYQANGRETTDQTKVGFRFATTPVHTQVNTTIISNTAIVIPPMVQAHEAITAFRFPADSRIHAFRPHMHLRGKSATATLILPESGARDVLLHLPRWDDAWQNYYVLSQPRTVPQDAIVEYIASYDNSPANALNPDPKVPVAWGQQVWEEMFETYITWTVVNDRNKDDHAPIQIAPDKAFTTGVTTTK